MKVIAVKLDSQEAVAKLDELVADTLGESTKDRLRRMVARGEIIYGEASILDPIIAGFDAGAASFMDGANVPEILSGALDEMRTCIAGTDAAFYTGTALFALSAIRMDIKEQAAKNADAEEYRIVEDEIPCRCRNQQCHKSIRAHREADGQIEVDFMWGGQVAGNIHLDRAGAKELAEQLLDARGCQ